MSSNKHLKFYLSNSFEVSQNFSDSTPILLVRVHAIYVRNADLCEITCSTSDASQSGIIHNLPTSFFRSRNLIDYPYFLITRYPNILNKHGIFGIMNADKLNLDVYDVNTYELLYALTWRLK